MKQAKMNRWRANMAEECLRTNSAVYCVDGYLEGGVVDMLSHLRHLCDRRGFDFDSLYERAEYAYDCERHPDGFELGLREWSRKAGLYGYKPRRNRA